MGKVIALLFPLFRRGRAGFLPAVVLYSMRGHQVGVGEGAGVAARVGEGVRVEMGVGEGVGVTVCEGVRVMVRVGVTVRVGVGVWVKAGVGERAGLGVGVGRQGTRATSAGADSRLPTRVVTR